MISMRWLHWSDGEVGLLRRWWPSGLPWSEIAQYFPGRSYYSCANKARHLGMYREARWVRERRVDLRVGRAISGVKWSPQEEELLRELWPSELPKSVLVMRFAGRSYHAVAKKARVMGLLRPHSVMCRFGGRPPKVPRPATVPREKPLTDAEVWAMVGRISNGEVTGFGE